MKLSVKHVIASISLAVCAIFAPSVASAQTGEKTVAFNAGFASYNDGGYASLSFQYTFAPHFRIAPRSGYAFRNDDKSAFVAAVDLHFPFRVARNFNIYPLAGVTLNNWEYDHHDDDDHDGHATRAGFDFGGGFDLYLARNFKIDLQLKYSLMNDTSGCFFTVGFGYVF